VLADLLKPSKSQPMHASVCMETGIRTDPADMNKVEVNIKAIARIVRSNQTTTLTSLTSFHLFQPLPVLLAFFDDTSAGHRRLW
jgi:hypothetical protein